MPASPAGDQRSEAGQGHQFTALKAFSAMPSLGKRVSPVQFRVRAPFDLAAIAVEPALKWVSYPVTPGGSTGDCEHFIDASVNSRYADVAETDSVTSVIND